MLTIKTNDQKVWVTFTFCSSDNVSNVSLYGEWSSWKEEPMKQKKSGDFYITKVFQAGNTYEFGYKVDGHWETEENCSRVPSPYSSENSLLKI